MAGAKTANKNSRTGAKSNAPQHSGDFKLLISCNGGRNAYVRNQGAGVNPNLATDSEAFTAAVATLAEAGFGAKLDAELLELTQSPAGEQWTLVRKRLAEAGVLA